MNDAPADDPMHSPEAARRAAVALEAAGRLAFAGISLASLALVSGGLVLARGVHPVTVLAFSGSTIAAGACLGALVSRLVRAAAARLRLLADQTDVLSKLDERLAASGGPTPPSAAPPAPDPRLADARRALRASAWAEAEALVRAVRDASPDDPDAERVAHELAEARAAAAQTVLAKIASAREANDPDRVIELREQLAPLLSPESLGSLDRDLAGWFFLLIQRRLRGGTVRADVAVLAGRVADALDATREGASLCAALPTLRRAAGLCPRCAQPYKGLADACPTCVATALAKATPPATAAVAWQEPPAAVPDHDDGEPTFDPPFLLEADGTPPDA